MLTHLANHIRHTENSGKRQQGNTSNCQVCPLNIKLSTTRSFIIIDYMQQRKCTSFQEMSKYFH